MIRSEICRIMYNMRHKTNKKWCDLTCFKKRNERKQEHIRNKMTRARLRKKYDKMKY